jgi:hypothetical protein
MSLYQIKTEMMSLLDAFARYGRDSDEAASAIREHAAAIAEAFDAKADDYAALIRVCETRAAARREESERMQQLAKDDEALAERLRKALLDAMDTTGRVRVDTPRFRIAVRGNGGKIPVIIESASDLPTEFVVPKITHEIDKTAIREALERGVPVSGARLGERGKRLDIS